MKITNLYHNNDIKKLKKNGVFVFGSNLAGNHAGGAAKFAADKFGAEDGIGEGMTGQCYAYPTLSKKMGKLTRDERKAVHLRFVNFAYANPKKTFYLTKVGCGIAGYTEDEIKEIATMCLPPNVIIPEGWHRRLIKTFADKYRSQHDSSEWKLDEWREVEGNVKLCGNGFHASQNFGEAFTYVNPDSIGIVEVDGDNDIESDKEAWERMRLVKKIKDTELVANKVRYSMQMAVLPLFENVMKDDDRPRKANGWLLKLIKFDDPKYVETIATLEEK
jgi:hypothetical protein